MQKYISTKRLNKNKENIFNGNKRFTCFSGIVGKMWDKFRDKKIISFFFTWTGFRSAFFSPKVVQPTKQKTSHGSRA